MKLLRIHVENFKSIKNQVIEFEHVNVLVGANGSGKTNILEFFKLIKLSLTSNRIPFNPFTPWWGFQNVVWKKDLDLTIKGTFTFEFEDNDFRRLRVIDSFIKNNNIISYSISLGQDQLGEYSIVFEELELPNSIRIEKKNQLITYTYDKNYFINSVQPVLEKYLQREPIKDSELMTKISNLIKTHVWTETTRSHLFFPRDPINSDTILLSRCEIYDEIILPFQLVKVISSERKYSSLPIINIIHFFNNIVFLRPPDLRKIREPVFPSDSNQLKEDGSNLVSALFRIMQKRQRKPIITSMNKFFKNMSVSVDFTKDGRLLMVVNEGDLELHPHGISDGFYKILFVLTGLYMKPSLLIIDEIENSLHFNAIEFLLDTIRIESTQTIITTHSPMIVDLLPLTDLLLCQKQSDKTVVKKPKNIETLKEQLSKDGLTHSDAWIVGRLEDE